jgi:hypothetical protein
MVGTEKMTRDVRDANGIRRSLGNAANKDLPAPRFRLCPHKDYTELFHDLRADIMLALITVLMLGVQIAVKWTTIFTLKCGRCCGVLTERILA